MYKQDKPSTGYKSNLVPRTWWKLCMANTLIIKSKQECTYWNECFYWHPNPCGHWRWSSIIHGTVVVHPSIRYEPQYRGYMLAFIQCIIRWYSPQYYNGSLTWISTNGTNIYLTSIRTSVLGPAREALNGFWRARLWRAPPLRLVQRSFFEQALEKEAPIRGVPMSLVFWACPFWGHCS
jgi:hypothetical protein